MLITSSQLKSFAQILAQNDVKIISSKLPTGEYRAELIHKKLGAKFNSSIRETGGDSLYLSGKGQNPREAALTLIQKLPKQGAIEFQNPNNWEDLKPLKSVDYKI